MYCRLFAEVFPAAVLKDLPHKTFTDYTVAEGGGALNWDQLFIYFLVIFYPPRINKQNVAYTLKEEGTIVLVG